MLPVARLELPSEAPTLAAAVAQAVRVGVAAGELVPDKTYSVYQLSELLGVSRSPVREALLQLAEAGLVRIARNRGFQIVLPTPHDIEEIIEIRLALEPPAARRAAQDGTEADHASLREALTRMAAALTDDDETLFWQADRAFHDRLLRAAKNARAASIIEHLRGITALLGPPTTASGRTLDEIVAEHQPIVEAVLARDGDTAEAAMRNHLERTGRLLVGNL
nr:GntR family transcriptional regulator [Pseudonocardia sp. C8]